MNKGLKHGFGEEFSIENKSSVLGYSSEFYSCPTLKYFTFSI